MKPRILYDHQIFDIQRFGGISRYFCEIMQRLNMKYDISIRFTINYYISKKKLSKHSIPIPRFMFRHYRKICQAKNQKLAEQFLKSKEPYVFHPTYYSTYFFKYIGDNPYVITVHDMIHEKFPHYFHQAEELIIQKREIIQRASHIIAISENTKKDIIDILHIDPNKIDVIYHCTSIKPYEGKPTQSLPKKFLLFVGDRTPYKNFTNLLLAFATLSKENEELSLICTGTRFTKNETELISNLKISDKIRQIKASDKVMSELYTRAELFVFPSYYEGFGIPILEAYACQCPVALSNASCFPEIAGEAGVYFNPYSVSSMICAIKSVMYDENLRTDLIKKGTERLRLYSWEKAALQTESVYQKVINQHKLTTIYK